MNWIELTDLNQLDEVEAQSASKPVLIFKHSSTCSLSRTALDRLQRRWNTAEASEVPVYFLNIQANRKVSDAIAERFSVRHESPQAIVLRNATVVYDQSHLGINYEEIQKHVAPALQDAH